jgi:hypothetical protein
MNLVTLTIKNTRKLIRKILFEVKYKLFLQKSLHPFRFRLVVSLLCVILLSIMIQVTFTNHLFQDDYHKFVEDTAPQKNPAQAIETTITKSESTVAGLSTLKRNIKVRSDVGFVDLRVLTLEDFFQFYKSPLTEYSDDLIEVCEKYDIKNWQLLPAIAIAETSGCQTGLSFEQKNCWGWGGAGDNRWEFESFDQAIDTIAMNLIKGYGNERMNAKDMQSTYCGRSCMDYGWKWAKGVNSYVIQINNIGEKYGLERTNEIRNFDE